MLNALYEAFEIEMTRNIKLNIRKKNPYIDKN